MKVLLSPTVSGVVAGAVATLVLFAADIPLEPYLNLGVGGLIAITVLIWKRGDDKEYQKRLNGHIERLDTVMDHILCTHETNIQAFEELTEAIESMQIFKGLTDEMKDMHELMKELKE